MKKLEKQNRWTSANLKSYQQIICHVPDPIAKIFVSYSVEDANGIARKVKHYFEKRDMKVFVAGADIHAGQDWEEEVMRNLCDCNIFVLLITRAALESEIVAKEVAEAKRLDKHIIHCKDVYADRAWNELPWDLGSIQGIEFEDSDELFRKLPREVYAAIGMYKSSKNPNQSDPPVQKARLLNYGDNTFRIPYDLSNGQLLNIEVDPDFTSIIISVSTTDHDGELTITLPRQLIDARIDGDDDDFIVLVDGNEADFDKTETTSTERTLKIPIPAGSEETEIIGTQIVEEILILSEIIFDKDEYTPTDEMIVSIISPSSNKDPKALENIDVRIYSMNADLGLIPFKETGPNTGIFEESFMLTPNTKLIPGDLQVSTGDQITVEFQITKDTVASKKAFVNYHVGQVMFDKDSYYPGERAVVRVIDPDENRNPNDIDTVEVSIWSTTDRRGLKLKLGETGDRTGIFEEIITLTDSGTSEGAKLRVSKGDTLTVKYVDRTLPSPVALTADRITTLQQEELFASVLIK